MVEITSLSYFFREVVRFRELMGSKKFWANPQQVRLAKKGLCHVYFNLEVNDKELDHAAVTFKATMNELLRRAILVGFDMDELT